MEDKTKEKLPKNERVQARSRNIFGFALTVSLTIVLIVGGVFLSKTALSFVTYSGEGVIKTESIDQVQPFTSDKTEAKTSGVLNIKVYSGILGVANNAISPYFAAASAAEYYAQTTGESLNGRVFVQEVFYPPSEYSRSVNWYVEAETDDGVFQCAVDMITGKVYENSAAYKKGSRDWSWFDNWDENAAAEGLLVPEITPFE